MAYKINRYNGELLTTLQDGTVDQTLDIKLVGKNYAGYGEIQNETFVHLLEHFSGGNAPPNAISGQVWFDTSTQKLKFYTSNNFWKTAGGVEYGTAPTNPYPGDLWFNTVTKQLNVYSNTGWLIVGPQNAGSGTTQMVSKQVPGFKTGSLVRETFSIVVATVNSIPVYIISGEEFRIDVDTLSTPLDFVGFTGTESRNIKKGLTLAYTTNTGVLEAGTSSANLYRYHGVASSAMGFRKSDGTFVSADAVLSIVSSTSSFGDLGFKVGEGNDFWVHIDSDGVSPVLESQSAATDFRPIKFKFQNTGGTVTPLMITDTGIHPVSALSTIGTATNKWSTIYATAFNGTASKADELKVGSEYRIASTSAGANTIAVRDNSGNLTASVFNGVAAKARYADLAEIYNTDVTYDIGTVIAVGGTKEVTAAQFGDRAIGVISEKPAYLMNSDADGQPVALKGRVPVKVTGAVKKSDRLVATGTGYAVCATPDQYFNVFAIALEASDGVGVKLVECLIL